MENVIDFSEDNIVIERYNADVDKSWAFVKTIWGNTYCSFHTNGCIGWSSYNPMDCITWLRSYGFMSQKDYEMMADNYE